MSDTELDREQLLEKYFGPAPSREQMLEALEHIDQMHREYILGVLQDCVSHDHAMYRLGLEFKDGWGLLEQKQLIGLPHGPLYFLPRWQFDEDEAGNWIPNQNILDQWELWGKDLDPYGFCAMMTREMSGYDITPVDALRQQDEGALREVAVLMQTHGINPS